MKSAHQNSMQRVKSKIDYMNISETNLQLAFEDYFSPEPGEQKTPHVFNHVCASSNCISCKYRTKGWNGATINTSNDSPVTTYLYSACNTSTSCMDTMSTPHLVPLSTNSELKGSMMTIVLRTGVWPSSRVCSSVSALFWLSQSTVEISAERRKLKLHYQLNRQHNSSKSWHQCCWYYEASSCTRLSSICQH